jgi:hypothetical protein
MHEYLIRHCSIQEQHPQPMGVVEFDRGVSLLELFPELARPGCIPAGENLVQEDDPVPGDLWQPRIEIVPGGHVGV